MNNRNRLVNTLRKRSEWTLDSLYADLDESLTLLSADDIHAMPEREVNRMLKLYGVTVDSEPPKQAYKGTGNFQCKSIMHSGSQWLVPRTLLMEKICKELADNVVIASGPKGVGKSHLLRMLMQRTSPLKAIAEQMVIVDCLPLRMDSVTVFDQDAVYAQFGSEEEDYRHFISRQSDDICSDDSTSDVSNRMLIRFILEKLNHTGGAVVFDHIEALSSRKILEWLKSCIAYLSKMSIKVLVVTDSAKEADALRLVKTPTLCSCKQLSPAEIKKWWKQPMFNSLRNGLNITAGDVYRLTGGSPRLVRDFARSVQNKLNSTRECKDTLFKRFLETQAKSYQPEVKRAMCILSEYPEHITDPTGTKNNKLMKKLLTTGVFRKSKTGSLEFVSDVFKQRYSMLSGKKGMRAMVVSGSDDRLLSGSYSSIQEIIYEKINASMIQEVLPSQAFRRLSTICKNQHVFGLQIFIREKSNAKLWKKAYGESGVKGNLLKPLYADKYQEFACAVQTGRICLADSNWLYLPVCSERGRIDIVLVGRYKPKRRDSYVNRLELRDLWALIQICQPAIAAAAHRFISKEDSRKIHQQYINNRINPEKAGSSPLDNLLHKAGSLALFVFKYSSEGWKIEEHRVLEKSGANENHPFQDSWETMFSRVNNGELSFIANHPSRRGLVLSGRRLRRVFPGIKNHARKMAVFSFPVGTDEIDTCNSIVAFVYYGSEADQICGEKQRHLSIIAPTVSSAAQMVK